MRWIFLTIAVLLAAGVAGAAGFVSFEIARQVSSAHPDAVACTEEAMQCPDGSYVGRSGPNCEFVCPSTSPPASTTTQGGGPVVGAGQHCGGFIQNAPVCAQGYYCQLERVPDIGGTCQPNP